MGQIRITPSELQSTAAVVTGIATEVNSQLDALKSKIDEVCQNWEGAAQISFIGDFNEIHAKFKEQFPPTIEGIAEKLNKTAETMEETDLKLSQMLGQ